MERLELENAIRKLQAEIKFLENKMIEEQNKSKYDMINIYRMIVTVGTGCILLTVIATMMQ